MNIIDKFKNHRLRYKEKCSNSCYRQLFRLCKMLIKSPLLTFDKGILKVMIGLTYECQCNCDYCCAGLYPKQRQKELSLEEFKKIITDINQIASVSTLVSFFGGEPLLREDIFDLVHYTTQKGLFSETETNGILLSLENVRKLKEAGLHHIFVRIENSNPEIHDDISKYNGCFEKAIKGIKYCVEEKLSCSISTIATKEKISMGQIEDIIDLGRSLGVTSIRILFPTLSGKWINEKSQILINEEESAVKKLLNPDFVYLESSYVCSKESDRICPSRIKKMFYISCYGELQPCPFVPYSFGNVRYNKLSEILEKMWRSHIFRNSNYTNNCFMNDSK